MRFSRRQRHTSCCTAQNAEKPAEQPAKTAGQESEEVVITAYVRNFTDELFLQSISGDIFPGNVAYGAPRRYGVTFQYNF